MKCEIKYVNSTSKCDLYCCYFGDYCTGTMLKDQADGLAKHLEKFEIISLQEVKKIFRYSSVGLYYSDPIHRIM